MGSWNCEADNWTLNMHFTSKLFGVVTVLQALIIYSAFTKQGRAGTRIQTEAEASGKAKSVSERLQVITQLFVTLIDFGVRSSPIDRTFHM